jgi:hypothetical protein
MSSGAIPPPLPTAQPTDGTQPPATGIPLPAITAAQGAYIALGILVTFLPAFLYCYGAAKLSFAKHQSYGWSILAFFFAVLYYPFYAWVLNTPSGVVGGRR